MFTVLINAGPWLAVPPNGYGGIENVVATLVPELRRHGLRVVLATVGASSLPVDEKISAFPTPQFDRLTAPYNQVMGVAAAHMQHIVSELMHRGTSTSCTTTSKRSGPPFWQPRVISFPRCCTRCTGI